MSRLGHRGLPRGCWRRLGARGEGVPVPLTSCSWVSGARGLGCGTEVAQRVPALPTMLGNGGSGCFTVGPACPAGAGTARAFCKWCLVGTNLSTCLGVRLWDKTPQDCLSYLIPIPWGGLCTPISPGSPSLWLMLSRVGRDGVLSPVGAGQCPGAPLALHGRAVTSSGEHTDCCAQPKPSPGWNKGVCAVCGVIHPCSAACPAPRDHPALGTCGPGQWDIPGEPPGSKGQAVGPFRKEEMLPQEDPRPTLQPAPQRSSEPCPKGQTPPGCKAQRGPALARPAVAPVLPGQGWVPAGQGVSGPGLLSPGRCQERPECGTGGWLWSATGVLWSCVPCEAAWLLLPPLPSCAPEQPVGPLANQLQRFKSILGAEGQLPAEPGGLEGVQETGTIEVLQTALGRTGCGPTEHQ